MKFNKYAQINEQGVCVAMLETSGTIDEPHMIEIEPGAERIGQRWTGTTWETIAPTEDETARRELEKIDRDVGMSRGLREALIAIADKVGADVSFLKKKEAQAAKARAKIKVAE